MAALLLIGALLLGPPSWLEPVLPVRYALSDPELGAIMAPVWDRPGLEQVERREPVEVQLARRLPELRHRRLLADGLPDGVGYHLPEATYLAWLDCRPLDLGPDPATYFLDRAGVTADAVDAALTVKLRKVF